MKKSKKALLGISERAENPLVYRAKDLPSLGVEQRREVVDEFRRVAEWAISVQQRLGNRPPWDGFGCPQDDGAVPYYSCENGFFKASPMRFNGVSFETSTEIGFQWGAQQYFLDSGGGLFGVFGAVGIYGQDALMVLGTSAPSEWDNPATRRNAGVGGYDVLLDVGNELHFKLPGVVPNDYGYDLHLSSNGLTVEVSPSNPPNYGPVTESFTYQLELDSQAWMQIPPLTHTMEEALEVGGVIEILVRFDVANTGQSSGAIYVGVGIDGSPPFEDSFDAEAVGAGFSGPVILNITRRIVTRRDPGAEVAVWYRVEPGRPQFNLHTVSGQQQTAAFQVTYGGGGGGGGGGITDHQLLSNRNPEDGGAHTAVAVSFDDSGVPFDADNVQQAIEELATVNPEERDLGWGGFYSYGPQTINLTGGSWQAIPFPNAEPMPSIARVEWSTQGWIRADLQPVQWPLGRGLLMANLALYNEGANGIDVVLGFYDQPGGNRFKQLAQIHLPPGGLRVSVTISQYVPLQVLTSQGYYLVMWTASAETFLLQSAQIMLEWA